MTNNASDQAEIIRIPNTTPVRERSWYKPILMVLGVLLFGTLCFGLGRLSRIEEAKPDLVVEQTARAFESTQDPNLKVQPSSQATKTQSGGQGAYVASKNGTKYYLPNCSGVSRINEVNIIWFATKAQAEARGLTPAANCPGL